jgi:HEPN superfamily RiboL-PSP-like protein
MPPPQSPLWAAVFRALLGGLTDRERAYFTPSTARASIPGAQVDRPARQAEDSSDFNQDSESQVPSKAKAKFDQNKGDVDQLWLIHEEFAGKGSGRKYGVDVLNRAAVVFVTACWEAFVEDLATEAFDFLLNNVPNALAVPSKVRDLSTHSIFEQKDSRRVWDLADQGWRPFLIAHKDAVLERWIGKLNTPMSKNVNGLFKEVLGIGQMSSNWHWQGMSVHQAEEKLDDYIAIRGNIAHRTAHDETVYKDWSADYLNHVNTLVEKTETATAMHLQNVTGKKAW